VIAVAILAAALAAPPRVAACPVFPASNVWNRRVDRLPVAPGSDAIVASIGAGTGVHADFGSGLWEGAPIGIPITVVGRAQPKVRVKFEYADESDRGPYPIPANVKIEGGRSSSGDRHAIVVDRSSCRLYELYALYPGWRAGSGAIWSLRSNRLRPAGWTSADAAGLPILPGLLRYDEAATGTIRHALRFTLPRARRAFQAPASHCGTTTDLSAPAYGSRWRLKASFDESPYRGPALAIVRALKRYGLMFADQGSAMFITGTSDPRWTQTIEDIDQRHPIPGDAFEVVAGPPVTNC
jgi:hypothetical protein